MAQSLEIIFLKAGVKFSNWDFPGDRRGRPGWTRWDEDPPGRRDGHAKCRSSTREWRFERAKASSWEGKNQLLPSRLLKNSLPKSLILLETETLFWYNFAHK